MMTWQEVREQVNRVAVAIARADGWEVPYYTDLVATAEEEKVTPQMRPARDRAMRCVRLAREAIAAMDPPRSCGICGARAEPPNNNRCGDCQSVASVAVMVIFGGRVRRPKQPVGDRRPRLRDRRKRYRH